MKQTKFWTGSEGAESAEELETIKTTTKKMFTLMVMILLWCNAFSQGYLSTSVMKNGLAANIGFLSGKTDINFGVQFPLTEITTPAIYHIEVGRMINLTNHEEGNDYSITPSIGAAFLKRKEVVTKPYEYLKTVSKTSAYYSLELGKDAYMGRVFLKTVYCGNIYYSVGMRLFLTRNN